MTKLHARLKISNVELNTGLYIIANRDQVSDVKNMLEWSMNQLILDAGKDAKLKVFFLLKSKILYHNVTYQCLVFFLYPHIYV